MKINIDYARDELLGDYAIKILKDRYMVEGEKSPQDAFARACTAFADNEAHAQRLYDHVSQLHFMFSTPILANGGTKRGLPISCFLQYVPDTLEGIIGHEAESSFLAAYGGGLGASWSALRTNKTKTSRGGESTGMVPFVAQFDRKVLAYRQAGTRRAAYAAYLDISHPEIIEFINIRKPSGGDTNRKATNIHNAVNIPDAFMNKLMDETDDNWELKDPHTGEVKEVVSARALWEQLLTLRTETGEPYIHFIDASNRALPQAQKDLGLKINTSNLCVAPETPILTQYGYGEIASFDNMTLDIWNGNEWSNVTVSKTAKNTKVITVTFSDGSSIDCTLAHNFYVQNSYGTPGVKTPASELVVGDRLEKWLLPTDLEGNEVLENAYAQGFYSGDGNTDLNHSWVYKSKYMCLPRLGGKQGKKHTGTERITWTHGPMLSKDFVPLRHTTKSKLNWLAGLLDADGCVIDSDNCNNIQLTGVDRNFLHNTKLMLQEIGVNSTLMIRRAEGRYMLPANDGTGESKEFNCKEVWLLNINGAGTKRLLELGLHCERLQFDSTQEPQRDASRFVTIKSIENKGRVTDTYCFSDAHRGRGMFNGVVTGNCSEITLATNEERTAVCCLSSVNLEKWDEWKDTTMVQDIIRMLDNVLDVFINAEHIKPSIRESIRKAIFSAERERSLGLGAMGFHSYLQSKMIPFESVDAYNINFEMFSKIRIQAEEASFQLALEKGVAPDYADSQEWKTTALVQGHNELMDRRALAHAKKHGWKRNMHLMAIAPNASSSILCGNTSPSIEPYSAVSFSQKTENGTHIFKNKYFQALLERKGMSPEEIKSVWRSISAKKGSVQHLTIFNDKEKDVFKTSYELDQEWVIGHAAARQKFIDQAQSVNLFFKAPIDVEYLHNVHYKAWKDGLKTLYYLRSKVSRSTEDVGEKIERKHFVQTKFETELDNGYKISCYGCE